MLVVQGNFIGVASGKGHSCAVKSDGQVECWGSNEHTGLQKEMTGIAIPACAIKIKSFFFPSDLASSVAAVDGLFEVSPVRPSRCTVQSGCLRCCAHLRPQCGTLAFDCLRHSWHSQEYWDMFVCVCWVFETFEIVCLPRSIPGWRGLVLGK